MTPDRIDCGAARPLKYDRNRCGFKHWRKRFCDMGGDKSLPVILYLHIPKAAGTTLGTILMQKFRRRGVLTIQDAKTAVEDLARLPDAKREKLQFIKGHFAYGLHEGLGRPFEYITMLREPVDRVVSHYYYVLRNPAHYLHARVTSKKMSLKDYALGGLTKEVDNGQVRLIAGEFYRDPCGQCSRELLEKAKENLRNHFAVVGLAERFDETLLVLGERYGWKDMFYTRQNATVDRARLDELPEDAVEAIEAANPLDAELCAFANELFEAGVRERGEGFQKRLASFRRENAASQSLLSSGIRRLFKSGLARSGEGLASTLLAMDSPLVASTFSLSAKDGFLSSAREAMFRLM